MTETPLYRNADPDTSRAAADQTREFRARHIARIYAALCSAGWCGLTKDEIAVVTGLDSVAVARRIAELRETVGVCDTGQRRKTPRGRMAIVWAIK